MIYQLTSPVLLLGVAAALLGATAPPFARAYGAARSPCDCDRRAVLSRPQSPPGQITANEKFIRDSMRRLVAEDRRGSEPAHTNPFEVGHAEPKALALERYPQPDARSRLAAKRRRLVSPAPWFAPPADLGRRGGRFGAADAEGVGNERKAGASFPTNSCGFSPSAAEARGA